jgi:hypothetical protein
MAISFVGRTQLGKVGSTTGVSDLSLTALTGGSGATALADDLVIAVFSSGSTADRTLWFRDSANTDTYTLIDTEKYVSSTNDVNLRVGYKFMGSTPDTFTRFGPTGAATDAGAMMVWVVRGVDKTTPLDGVTPTSASSVVSLLVNPASITPATAGAWPVIVGAGGHAGGADTYTATELTSFFSVGGANDTQDTMIGIGYRAGAQAGVAYDGAAWTSSEANAATHSYATISFVLRAKASEFSYGVIFGY